LVLQSLRRASSRLWLEKRLRLHPLLDRRCLDLDVTGIMICMIPFVTKPLIYHLKPNSNPQPVLQQLPGYFPI